MSTVTILWAGFLLTSPACEAQPEFTTDSSVAFVVYDAGETLGLLPVAPHLRSRGLHVRWIPLTPWSADLLTANGEIFLPLPDGVEEMPHVRDRWIDGDVGYWEAALLERGGPALVVSGMVSAAQGTIAARLGADGVLTRGFHDGFQPPTAEAISARTAPHFQEIWVPTTRVQEGFRVLGLESVVVGQPSLEAWRRTADAVDPDLVRRRQGVGAGGRILLFAGQYGPGYPEVLASFLRAMRGPLRADSSLVLVIAHHPRTDGAEENSALRAANLPRAVPATEGLSTMDLATVADVVLTWTSTVGIQAAFMGKEVIYYSPDQGFDTHVVDRGVAREGGEETLAPRLAEALAEPRSPEAIRSALVDAGYVVDADVAVADLIQRAMGG